MRWMKPGAEWIIASLKKSFIYLTQTESQTKFLVHLIFSSASVERNSPVHETWVRWTPMFRLSVAKSLKMKTRRPTFDRFVLAEAAANKSLSLDLLTPEN